MGKAKKDSNNVKDQTVEVLYQKMGDRWFAFSLIDDDIFFGSISDDDLDGEPIPMQPGSPNTTPEEAL